MVFLAGDRGIHGWRSGSLLVHQDFSRENGQLSKPLVVHRGLALVYGRLSKPLMVHQTPSLVYYIHFRRIVFYTFSYVFVGFLVLADRFPHVFTYFRGRKGEKGENPHLRHQEIMAVLNHALAWHRAI